MKKILGFLAVVLMIVIVPVTMISKEEYQKYLNNYNYSQTEQNNDEIEKIISESNKQGEEETTEEKELYTEVENGPIDSLDKATLNEKQLNIYEQLLKQIQAFQKEYAVVAADEEDVVKAYKAIAADYPEYFWTSGMYSWQTTYQPDSSESKVVIMQKSGYSMDQLRTMYEEMMQKVNALSAQATSKTNDYDKILYVHDFLAKKVSYDFESYKANNKGTTKLLLSSTAYNPMVADKAICSGYSAAFQLVMNKLGYPCGRISGKDGKTKEGHEWNYICAGGKYFYVDVTWDSPASDEPGAKKKDFVHDYFGITEKEILMTRSINQGELKPVCDSTDFDYYRHNGLFFEKYSFDAVANAYKEKGGKVFAIKFASVELAKRAEKDLMDNGRFGEIIGEGKHWSWYCATSGLSLTILQ